MPARRRAPPTVRPTAEHPARPATAARSAVAGLLLVLAGLAAGCSATLPLPLVKVPVQAGLQLAAPEGGVVERLAIRVTLSPGGELPVRVAGVRSDAATAEERSLLDLDLAWTDFRGDGPRSLGRSERFVLPFVAEGDAAPGAPLIVERTVELPAAAGVLARRVAARARLIGIDLQLEHGHTGGTLLVLPEAELESFEVVPPGTLAQHLQSGSVPGIFLSAASARGERREQALAMLVAALPATPEPARGAIFAALLYLTGETHGRDIYRWSSWWKARQAAIDATRSPAP